MTSTADTANSKLTGTVLIASSLMVILTMAHHPSGPEGMSGLVVVVHGIMILLMLLLFTAFLSYSAYRRFQNPSVLFALVCYGTSVLLNIGAATVNGFVVGALANRETAVNQDIFRLCWEINQALARLGVATMGLAVLFWSIDLFRRQKSARWIALFGFPVALLPLVWFAVVSSDLGVTVAIWVYGGHAVGAIGRGRHLRRGVL
ncbi:MAG: hypothetical protein AAF438_06325 [Pseudomonadota bacterium]